ncbi:MAG: hypothetical protein WCX27_01285 [Candidatus Paceibacterota bacterium]|jgi:hypothetical protein
MPEYDVVCLLSGQEKPEIIRAEGRNKNNAENWVKKNFFVKQILKVRHRK